MNDRLCEILVKIGACLMVISGACAAWGIASDVFIVLLPASFAFCIMIVLIDRLWFAK